MANAVVQFGGDVGATASLVTLTFQFNAASALILDHGLGLASFADAARAQAKSDDRGIEERHRQQNRPRFHRRTHVQQGSGNEYGRVRGDAHDQERRDAKQRARVQGEQHGQCHVRFHAEQRGAQVCGAHHAGRDERTTQTYQQRPH